jgi:hypothetical protein
MEILVHKFPNTGWSKHNKNYFTLAVEGKIYLQLVWFFLSFREIFENAEVCGKTNNQFTEEAMPITNCPGKTKLPSFD